MKGYLTTSLVLELVWCFWLWFLNVLNKHTEHTKNLIRLSTRMNKAYLRGILDIHKVHEAQICRWKKIMPHSWEETVTQISTFTSQRYKVLWGLAKSDKILLPKEVSFNSPLIIYTLSEQWSWGHPKGWWNHQAGLLKKRKTRPLISCAPKITRRCEGREYISGLVI